MNIEIDLEGMEVTLEGRTYTITRGSLGVDYEWHRGDRDIGEPSRYVEWEFDSPTATIHLEDEDEVGSVVTLELRRPGPDWQWFLDRLEIHEYCERD